MEHYLENLAPLASYAIAVLFRTVVCVSVCVCYVCVRYNKSVSINDIHDTLLLVLEMNMDRPMRRSRQRLPPVSIDTLKLFRVYVCIYPEAKKL